MLGDSRGEDESAADDGDDPVTVHQSPGAVSEERLARAGVERIEEREGCEVLGLGERGPEAKVLDEEVLAKPLRISTYRRGGEGGERITSKCEAGGCLVVG